MRSYTQVFILKPFPPQPIILSLGRSVLTACDGQTQLLFTKPKKKRWACFSEIQVLGKEGVEAHQGRRGTGRGAARRRDRHRGREKSRGWDGGRGKTPPPAPLAIYLPQPLLTLPSPPLSMVAILFSKRNRSTPWKTICPLFAPSFQGRHPLL